MSERAYVVRLGAFGDNLVITPVLKELKNRGYHVILEYSDRGEPIFRNNPYIDEHIYYKKNSIPFEKLNGYWKNQAKKLKADKIINFSETLEVALAVHPRSPRYNYSKTERFMLCNKNYYEYSMNWAGLDATDLRPELYFDDKELTKVDSYLKKDMFNILICMSGSGKHKVYPWHDILVGSILNEYPDAYIITVGDLPCKIIEAHADRVTNLSGDINIRTAMALTKVVDLVISPDTGVLHASGCYKTPKIGLLGHTTIENITKHFLNDYSVESNSVLAECSPCFRLIYNMKQQCPVDPVTGAAYCMAKGIVPEEVFKKVKKVYDKHYARAEVTI